MSIPKFDLKNNTIDGKKIETSCESCTRLPVCWLVVSLKNALKGHEEQTGTLMFEWKKLGEICEQYHTLGPIITVGGL